MQITRQIAMNAALDAGNRSMRAAGRKKWSLDDRIACNTVFLQLMGVE